MENARRYSFGTLHFRRFLIDLGRFDDRDADDADNADDGSNNGNDDGSDDGNDDGSDDGNDDGSDDGSNDGSNDGNDELLTMATMVAMTILMMSNAPSRNSKRRSSYSFRSATSYQMW